MSEPSRFNILSVETIAKLWSRVSKVTLEYTRRDGKQEQLIREVVDHGSAAALLPIDPLRNTVLLVKQWRIGAYMAGHHAPLLEVCAGLLDADDPKTCAEREAVEELGYRVHDLQATGSAFASPGALTERIYLFLGRYDQSDKISSGGGLASEGEDIEVVELPLSQAHAMIASGEIVDAKTIILLQMALADNQQLPPFKK